MCTIGRCPTGGDFPLLHINPPIGHKYSLSPFLSDSATRSPVYSRRRSLSPIRTPRNHQISLIMGWGAAGSKARVRYPSRPVGNWWQGCPYQLGLVGPRIPFAGRLENLYTPIVAVGGLNSCLFPPASRTCCPEPFLWSLAPRLYNAFELADGGLCKR